MSSLFERSCLCHNIWLFSDQVKARDMNRADSASDWLDKRILDQQIYAFAHQCILYKVRVYRIASEHNCEDPASIFWEDVDRQAEESRALAPTILQLSTSLYSWTNILTNKKAKLRQIFNFELTVENFNLLNFWGLVDPKQIGHLGWMVPPSPFWKNI